MYYERTIYCKKSEKCINVKLRVAFSAVVLPFPREVNCAGDKAPSPSYLIPFSFYFTERGGHGISRFQTSLNW